ncbi:hypothetical protein SGGMMB4_04943 [Sodalis glossinidius str. 'morsitans']|uniref:Uncharacterized protein n=1 Tax=Sodalis glossinidius (strain morsitans) TaxID=343509 RepID=A0A193QMH6_SODGM|nr:hypothetical protein SGGMMB4_04943 [Sodalis glossinidius str. 'morsitans']
MGVCCINVTMIEFSLFFLSFEPNDNAICPQARPAQLRKTFPQRSRQEKKGLTQFFQRVATDEA